MLNVCDKYLEISEKKGRFFQKDVLLFKIEIDINSKSFLIPDKDFVTKSKNSYGLR